MNWYKIFYWISVADNVSTFFQVTAIVASIAFVLSTIGYFVCTNAKAEYVFNPNCRDYKEWAVWHEAWKRAYRSCLWVMIFGWLGFCFCPSKRDSLIIVTGGAVGNFITSDSSAKAIPSEAMTLLRERIRHEINEINNPLNKTVEEMTKEELIEYIKKQKK